MQGAAAYRAIDHTSAPPEKLLILLYEKAISEQARARLQLEAGDKMGALPHLRRTREIFVALTTALDHEVYPGLTGNLHQLYTWAIRQLIQVGQSGDPNGLNGVQEMTESLYDTWQGALQEGA